MTRKAIIHNIESYICDIPLIRPHVMSFGSPDSVSFNLVRIETQGGFIGWGEVSTFQGPTWSEETSETIKIIIDRYIAPDLIGHDALMYRPLLSKVSRRVQGNHFAKAAVEMALFDVVGRFLNQPVSTLLGGRYRERIPLSWSLASGSLTEDVDEARHKISEGYTILKLKAGGRSLHEDLLRLQTVRQELGPEVRLRVDVNQGWDYPTALQALHTMEKLDVELIEQPLPKQQIHKSAQLRKSSSIPLMADECLTGVHSALDIIAEDAFDIFSFKLSKLGGIAGAKDVYTISQAAQIAAYIGCMIETSLGTAAYLHFGASLPSLTYGCELWGPLLLQDDIVCDPVRYAGGQVEIPAGEGLGVMVDEEKVRQYLRDS